MSDVMNAGERGERKMKAIYTIVKKEGQEKGIFVKIGAGWPNRDGSINGRLDALPVNGEIHIRDYVPYKDGARGGDGGRRDGEPRGEASFGRDELGLRVPGSAFDGGIR